MGLPVLSRILRGTARIIKRAYEAVTPSAFNSFLLGNARRTTADREHRMGGERVGEVARELVRNQAMAASIVEEYWKRVVGAAGIRLQLNTGSASFDKFVEKRWRDWCRRVTIDGHSMRSLQRLLARELATKNETFAHFGIVGDQLVITAFEPEDLDCTTDFLGVRNNGSTYHGITYDELRRPVSYRVAVNDPGGMIAYSKFVDIPADRVAHIWDPDRPSQTRATSQFDATTDHLFGMSRSKKAEIDNLRCAATFGLHIETSDPADEVRDGLGLGSEEVDSLDKPGTKERKIEFGQGGFVNVGNYKANMLSANRPGGGYVPLAVNVGQGVAARHGLPYSAVSGDYGQSAYVGMRREEQNCQATAESGVALLAERGMDRFFRAWLETEVVFGRITLGRMTIDEIANAASWLGQGGRLLDPQKESLATATDLGLGMTTWSNACLARGIDPAEQMAAIKREQELAKSFGIEIPVAGSMQGVPNVMPDPSADTTADPSANADNPPRRK